MAIKNNQKIRDMVEILSPVGDEMIPVAKGGKNYKVALDTIVEYVGVEGGGVSNEIEAQVEENTKNIAGNTSAIANLIQGKQDRITEGDGINLDRVNNALSIRLGTAEQTIDNKQQVVTIGGLTFNEKGELCIKLGSNLTFGQYGSLDCTVEAKEYGVATSSTSGLMSNTDKQHHDSLWTFYQGTDTDSTINKWKEIENFLAGLTETDVLMDITTKLQGQIDGLLSRDSFDDLYVGHAMADSIATERLYADIIDGSFDTLRINDYNDTGDVGTIRFSSNCFRFDGDLFANDYIVATEHWVDSNYLPLSGSSGFSMLSEKGIKWAGGNSSGNSDQYDSSLFVGFDVVEDSSLSQYGGQYSTVLNVGGVGVAPGYRWQMAAYAGGRNDLYFRTYNNNNSVWLGWKTIAFTDSTVANALALGGHEASYYASVDSVTTLRTEIGNTLKDYAKYDELTELENRFGDYISDLSDSNATNTANIASLTARVSNAETSIDNKQIKLKTPRYINLDGNGNISINVDNGLKIYDGFTSYIQVDTDTIATRNHVSSSITTLSNSIASTYATKELLGDYAPLSSLEALNDMYTSLSGQVVKLSTNFGLLEDWVEDLEADYFDAKESTKGQFDGLWSRNSYDDLYIGHAMADSIATERLYADIIDGSFDTLRINDFNGTGDVGTIQFSSNCFRFNKILSVNDNEVATQGWVGDNYLPLSGSSGFSMLSEKGMKWAGGNSSGNSDQYDSSLFVGFDVVEDSSLSQYGGQYSTVLNVGGVGVAPGYRWQMAAYAGGRNDLYFRTYNNNNSVWLGWKTIAFTDSTVANALALGGHEASYYASVDSVTTLRTEIGNTLKDYAKYDELTELENRFGDYISDLSDSNATNTANIASLTARVSNAETSIDNKQIKLKTPRYINLDGNGNISINVDNGLKIYDGFTSYIQVDTDTIATRNHVSSSITTLSNSIASTYATKELLGDYAPLSSLEALNDMYTSLSGQVVKLSTNFGLLEDWVEDLEADYFDAKESTKGQFDGLWSRNSYDDLYIGHAMADSIATERLYADIIDGSFNTLQINDYNDTGEVGIIQFSSNCFRFNGSLSADGNELATQYWVGNNYLSLSGGVINDVLSIKKTGSDTETLSLCGGSSANRIAFRDGSDNSFQGYLMHGWGNLILSHKSLKQLGVGNGGIWCSLDNGTTKKQLIHEGNIGSYTAGNANGLIASSNTNYGIALGKVEIGSNLYMSAYPIAPDYMCLGGPSNYYYNVYATSYQQGSDATLKNVIGDVDLTVREIANAPAVEFTWKRDGRKDVGTIAQYWKDVLPEVVSGEEGSMGMNYATLGVVSAIVLARSMETHEERISRLERENEALRKEILTLKDR